jgi:hypothetical protein
VEKPLYLSWLLWLLSSLPFWLSFRSEAKESASSFAVALALVFLAVILSGAKNLLLARAASARSPHPIPSFRPERSAVEKPLYWLLLLHLPLPLR